MAQMPAPLPDSHTLDSLLRMLRSGYTVPECKRQLPLSSKDIRLAKQHVPHFAADYSEAKRMGKVVRGTERSKKRYYAEGHLQQEVIDFFRARSAHVVDLSRVPNPRDPSTRGIPDLIVTWSGSVFWIELKSLKGHLRESQQRRHSAIRRAGGVVFVVRNLDDAQHAFEQIRSSSMARRQPESHS